MKIFRIISSFILIFLIGIPGALCKKALSQEPIKNSVKIGLLIQDEKSAAAKQAAALAIGKANEKGGLNGTRFELVVRSMEGPWGTGSKQAVELIFEENVWALLGSHDGRNAHLVEQAATKAGVVFMSCWSGDPTLSQAFVPWFFNCVPNYDQQAEALINELYYIKKFNRIISVTDNTYDSNQAFLSFIRKAGITGKKEQVRLKYEEFTKNPDSLADIIIKENPDGILLFCNPAASSRLVLLLSQRKFNKSVFGFTTIANENELSEREMIRFDNILKMPAAVWDDQQTAEFVKEYRNMYGKMPGMAAAYAFDGMNALIEALIISGIQDREKIQEALENIKLNGVTGQIRFDARGNRSSPLSLRYIKNGLPVQ